MLGLVFYFSICIFVSFLCSLLEACLLSLPKSYIASLQNQGHPSAARLLYLKENINRPLAAILSLNTVAHTAGAAGVGAKVLELYGDQYVAIGSFVLTIAVLILSEIIPKTIGTLYSKALARPASLILPPMIYLAYPFVIVSEKISSIISHSVDDEDSKFSRDEMLASAQIGETDGTIQVKESIIIKNLLNLSKLNVQDIMTPLSEVVLFPQYYSVEEALASSPMIRYSRIPVYGENFNDIVGMVLRYQLMKAKGDGNVEISLDKMLNPIRSVSKNISVTNALQQFIKHKEHMFIVVNDYGATTGIISLEDAIEALLGEEIVDEFDYDSASKFSLEHDSVSNRYIIRKGQDNPSDEGDPS